MVSSAGNIGHQTGKLMDDPHFCLSMPHTIELLSRGNHHKTCVLPQDFEDELKGFFIRLLESGGLISEFKEVPGNLRAMVFQHISKKPSYHIGFPSYDGRILVFGQHNSEFV